MSSCEFPGAISEANQTARVTEAGSRLHRFQAATSAQTPNTWSAVAIEDYKTPSPGHCGVLRSVLAGKGDQTRFEVRYFEISPEGFSSREHHRHEHVVIVLRGQGSVWLAGTWYELGHGDVVYIAPDEVHQLRNTREEPFGFFCVVDAERDRPVPVED